MKPTTRPAAALENALDQRDYEWLLTNAPTVVDAIEKAIDAGMTAVEVRNVVQRRYRGDRDAFARYCETAARHIAVLREAA